MPKVRSLNYEHGSCSFHLDVCVRPLSNRLPVLYCPRSIPSRRIVMRERTLLIATLLLTPFARTAAKVQDQQLYVVPDNAETRWSSFENAKAEEGQGGAENKTAKGHAFAIVPPGQTRVLLDVKGAGLVQRIWMTISNRTPAVLRSARIEMYW